MIESKLKKILAKQFGILEDKITLETDVVSNLGADSLDLTELVMNIEYAFKIVIEEDEYTGAHTVGSIVELIKAKDPK